MFGTIFLDFDDTIVESNKRIIEMINDKYHLNKSENDLVDYGYHSIMPLSREEIKSMFEDDSFFEKLEFKPGVIDALNKYKDKYNIVITTKGTQQNLIKKEKWIKENLGSNFIFNGLYGDTHDKSSVDMSNSIQIDDNANCLNTNAPIKILYKSENNYSWQQIDANTEIMQANTWNEIEDILDFYLMYDFKTLERKKK